MSTKLRFCRPMLNSMYRISRGPGSSSPKSRPPPLPFSSSSTRLSHLDDDEERGSDVDVGVGVDAVVVLDWRVVHVLSRANNDAKGLSASDGENANDSSAEHIMTKHTRAAAEAVGELVSMAVMAAMCGCRWENCKINEADERMSGRNVEMRVTARRHR